jgi:hypothetical protein
MRYLHNLSGLPQKTLKCYFLFLLALFGLQSLQAQPVITSFLPAAGFVGTEVIINGDHFSPVAANNVVFFGRVRATVSAATATSLKVTVPLRATYQFISVTTNRLTAYSAQPFTVISGGALTPASYPTRWAVGVSGKYPSGLMVGDWNDDGKPDLLAANFNTDNLSLFQSGAYSGVMQMNSEVKFATAKMPEGTFQFPEV